MARSHDRQVLYVCRFDNSKGGSGTGGSCNRGQHAQQQRGGEYVEDVGKQNTRRVFGSAANRKLQYPMTIPAACRKSL